MSLVRQDFEGGFNLIYITGDKHREFDSVAKFCFEMETTKDDILIILGDAGINFYGDMDDQSLKEKLSELPITLFCIHGNHELRPYLIDSYDEIPWQGGVAYQEAEFPNLIFAKDGEIYNLEGVRCIAIGGAYSVGGGGLPDEQPTDEIKEYVEDMLDAANWKIDVVFSHTCPYSYRPKDMFLPYVSREIDNSTEKWLDSLERRLDYDVWYCGHFHADRLEGKICFVFEDFVELV